MYSSDDILGVSMRYLRARGFKKIAVLNGTDASGQDADQILRALIKTPEYANAGVTFVAYEHYNLTDLSVDAQLRGSRRQGRRPSSRSPPARRSRPCCTACKTSGSTSRSSRRPGTCPTRRWNRTRASCRRNCSSRARRRWCPTSCAIAAFAMRSRGSPRRSRPPAASGPICWRAVAWDPMGLLAAALANAASMQRRALRAELASTRLAGALGRYNFVATPQRGVTGLGDHGTLGSRQRRLGRDQQTRGAAIYNSATDVFGAKTDADRPCGRHRRAETKPKRRTKGRDR